MASGTFARTCRGSRPGSWAPPRRPTSGESYRSGAEGRRASEASRAFRRELEEFVHGGREEVARSRSRPGQAAGSAMMVAHVPRDAAGHRDNPSDRTTDAAERGGEK